MQQIKFTESVDRYREGEVLWVDENSAASLIERGLAVKFDGDAGGEVKVAAIAEADLPDHYLSDPPEDEAADPAGAEVTDDADAVEVTRSSNKPELVAAAVKAGVPDDEANAKTKAELADTLGLP